jgi:hypothetical protein
MLHRVRQRTNTVEPELGTDNGKSATTDIDIKNQQPTPDNQEPTTTTDSDNQQSRVSNVSTRQVTLDNQKLLLTNTTNKYANKQNKHPTTDNRKTKMLKFDNFDGILRKSFGYYSFRDGLREIHLTLSVFAKIK